MVVQESTLLYLLGALLLLVRPAPPCRYNVSSVPFTVTLKRRLRAATQARRRSAV